MAAPVEFILRVIGARESKGDVDSVKASFSSLKDEVSANPARAAGNFFAGLIEGAREAISESRGLQKTLNETKQTVASTSASLAGNVDAANDLAKSYKSAAKEADELQKNIKLLKDFGGGSAQSEAAIKSLEDRLGSLKTKQQETTQENESMLGSFVKGAAIVEAAKVAFSFLVDQYKLVREATTEMQQNNLRLEATFESLGATATTSAARLREIAESLKASTTLDDDQILKVGAALAGQSNLTGETIERVLKSSADLAALTGKSYESVVTSLGKALESPLEGMRSLKGLQVQLTDAQKENIKTLEAQGDLYGAQQVILAEVERRTAGLAEKMNSGLAKASADNARAIDDLRKSLGELIFDDQERGVNKFAASLNGLTEQVKNLSATKPGLLDFVAVAGSLLPGGGGVQLNQRLVAGAQARAVEAENARETGGLSRRFEPTTTSESINQIRVNAETASSNLKSLRAALRTDSERLNDDLKNLRANYEKLATASGGALSAELRAQQAQDEQRLRDKFNRGGSSSTSDDGRKALDDALRGEEKARSRERLASRLDELDQERQLYENLYANLIISEEAYYASSVRLFTEQIEAKRQANKELVDEQQKRLTNADAQATTAPDEKTRNQALAEAAKARGELLNLQREAIKLDKEERDGVEKLALAEQQRVRQQTLATAEQTAKLQESVAATARLAAEQQLSLAFAREGLQVDAAGLQLRQGQLQIAAALRAEERARLDIALLEARPAELRNAAWLQELNNAKRALELAKSNTAELTKQSQLRFAFALDKSLVDAQVALRKLVDESEFELSLLGKSKEEVELMKVAREGQLEVAKAQAVVDLLTTEALKEQLENENGLTEETQRRLEVAGQLLQITRDSANVKFDLTRAKQQFNELAEIGKVIKDALGKSIEDAFTGAKKPAEAFKDFLKTLFNKLILTPGIKFLTDSIGDLFTGGNSAGSGGGGAGGLLNQLFGGGGGLLGGLARDDGVGGVIQGTGILGGLERLFPSLGKILGPLQGIGKVFGQIGAGFTVGNLISNGYGLGSRGQGSQLLSGAGAALGQFLIPIPGLGAIIGGAIAGVVNRLFGRKLKDSGIEATFTEQQTTGRSFEFFKGGLFRSDKTVFKDLDPELLKALEEARKGIVTNVEAIADGLGLGSEAFKNFSFSFKLSTKGLNEQQIQDALNKQFSELGKAALRTLDFSSIDKSAGKIVSSFEGTGDELFKFAQRLIAVKESVGELTEVIPILKDNLGTIAQLPEDIGNAFIAVAQQLSPKIAESINALFVDIDLTQSIGSIVKPDVTVFGRWQELGAQIRETAAKEGADIREIAALAQARYQTEAQLIQSIVQYAREAAAQFESNAEFVRRAGLDNQELYQYLDNLGAALRAELETAIDPERIRAIGGQLANIQRESFSLLDKDQQLALKDEFLALITRDNELVQTRLRAAGEEIAGDKDPGKEGSTAAALKEVLESAADKFFEKVTNASDAIDKAGDNFAADVEAAGTQLRTTIGNAAGELTSAADKLSSVKAQEIIVTDGRVTTNKETGQFSPAFG